MQDTWVFVSTCLLTDARCRLWYDCHAGESELIAFEMSFWLSSPSTAPSAFCNSFNRSSTCHQLCMMPGVGPLTCLSQSLPVLSIGLLHFRLQLFESAELFYERQNRTLWQVSRTHALCTVPLAGQSGNQTLAVLTARDNVLDETLYCICPSALRSRLTWSNVPLYSSLGAATSVCNVCGIS